MIAKTIVIVSPPRIVRMRYINIHRLTELPDISALAPFKAVISAEEPATAARQAQISKWLVEMGCKYAMCCGEYCESWRRSVREANLEICDLDTMHARDFVMTTEHRYESLKAVFWYSKKAAKHPEVETRECVVLHLGSGERSAEYQSIYHRA